MMRPRYRAAIAPLRRLLVAIALATLSAGAFAQDAPTRVVIVPFQGGGELGPWEIGLPAGIGRSLNAVPGTFVPPIGDPLTLAERAADAGMDPVQTVFERFRADRVLTGTIARAPSGLDVTMHVLTPSGPGATVTLTVASEPASALPDLVQAALDLLELPVDAAGRQAALAVAASAPDIASLQAVGVATARLAAADPNGLRAAAELAPDSSWVASEWARAASLANDHEAALAAAERAVASEPADVEAWTVLGLVALRANQPERATEAYRAALDRNPWHALARVGLADLAAGEAELERELDRALEAYPRLVEAHRLRAERLGGVRALQALRSAAAAVPDSATLHREVVRAALRAGDPAGAAAYLRDALRAPLARRPSVFALASELPVSHREVALELFRDGAEAFPEDVGLAVAEARLLRRTGDPAAAEQRLAPLEEQASDDLRWINEMALAVLEQGRTEEGRELLARGAADDATLAYNLGQALLRSGLPRAAAETLAPLADAAPQDVEVQTAYGLALAASGRVDEAREVLTLALELDPNATAAERGLERLEERAAIGQEAADPLPQEAQAAFEQGLTDLESGRFVDAAAAFARAAAAAPDRRIVDVYLGNALQRSGDPAGAIEAYERALEAYPESGTLLNNVGFAWLQLGRYDRALPTLRQAVEASPENGRAHLNLGLTLYGLQRFQDALDAWDRATELEPSLEPSIREARERARERAGDGTP